VDFRQERRWKQALAMVISKAVMEYHLSEDKKSLQAKVSISSSIQGGVAERPSFCSNLI